MIESMSPVGSPAREQEEDDARDALGVGYVGTFLEQVFDEGSGSLTRSSQPAQIP
jgi:hypothetical protein